MNTLVESQVFMPVRDDINIAGFQSSQSAALLVIQDENGTNILVIFTSPDRAHNFLQDHDGFTGGMVEIFGKIPQMNGVGYSVTIKLGEEVGMDLEPDIVEHIVRPGQAA